MPVPHTTTNEFFRNDDNVYDEADDNVYDEADDEIDEDYVCDEQVELEYFKPTIIFERYKTQIQRIHKMLHKRKYDHQHTRNRYILLNTVYRFLYGQCHIQTEDERRAFNEYFNYEFYYKE